MQAQGLGRNDLRAMGLWRVYACVTSITRMNAITAFLKNRTVLVFLEVVMLWVSIGKRSRLRCREPLGSATSIGSA